MAEYKKAWEKPKGPHAYNLILEDIKSETLKNILLFHGREQFFVEWAVDLVKKKYVNPACASMDFVRLEGEALTVDNIILACDTLSMFSEKRVVWAKDFAPLTTAKGRGFSADDESRLLAYLRKLPQSCVLIFSAGDNTDGRKKLVKDISSLGKAYDFTKLDEDTLRTFIIGRMRRAGKFTRNPVMNALIERSGYSHKDSDYDLFRLENDLKKLMAYSRGEEIFLSDVEACVDGDPESDVFQMIDAASRGRKDEAYQIFFHFMERQKDEAVAYLPLSLLASQYELLLSIKELAAERKSLPEMKKILGAHEFRIKKAMELRDRYKVSDLRRILMSIYAADRNVKSGLIPIRLSLEMLVAQL